MSKILHLTLKKKWFDMELAGIKNNEYREIKPYWLFRLINFKEETESQVIDEMIGDMRGPNRAGANIPELMDFFNIEFKKFDIIRCVNGYGKSKPSFDRSFLGLDIGTGRSDWGAQPGHLYFILRLGKILSKRNI